MIEQYNNDTIAIFSSQNKVSGFEIHRETEVKKYSITGIEDGSIFVVREYSPSEAIIGVVHNSKTSSILLYSLINGTIVKQEKVDFPIDNVLKVTDNWIAMCTTEDEGNSSVKIQGCFGEKENKTQIT